MNILIRSTIPAGKQVNVFKDKLKAFQFIKNNTNIDFVLEDVEIPEKLSGEQLLNFADGCEKLGLTEKWVNL